MSKPSWECLDDFLATDDDGGFATPAIVRFQDGTRKPINVIFDDPYFNVELGEYEADASQPRITGKETDLLRVRKGDLIKVDDTTYEAITSYQPDGTGMAVVQLAPTDDSL